MKKIISVLFIILLAFSFVGCSKYVSSFSATVLITSQDHDSAKMSFSTFKGTKVFALRCDDDDGELEYKAELEEGSMTVYIDQDGEKVELFSIGAGEKVSSDVKISKGYIYVIIESTEKSKKGSFEFDVDD